MYFVQLFFLFLQDILFINSRYKYFSNWSVWMTARDWSTTFKDERQSNEWKSTKTLSGKWKIVSKENENFSQSLSVGKFMQNIFICNIFSGFGFQSILSWKIKLYLQSSLLFDKEVFINIPSWSLTMPKNLDKNFSGAIWARVWFDNLHHILYFLILLLMNHHLKKTEQ